MHRRRAGNCDDRREHELGWRGGGAITRVKPEFESQIIRHGERNATEFVGSHSPSMELIVEHIETHLGETSLVIHEVVSQFVHVDIHIVPPKPGRDFCTLVTCGMSDKPMNVPQKLKGMGLEFAELLLCLPKSWRVEGYDAVSDRTREKDWPVLWLRNLARFPHEYNTWLSTGHSVPNGDPALPLSTDTEMSGWVLTDPKLVPEAFKCLVREDGSKIFFHAALPVYREEMAMKIAQGSKKLQQMFAEFGVTELLDPRRINVATNLMDPSAI